MYLWYLRSLAPPIRYLPPALIYHLSFPFLLLVVLQCISSFPVSSFAPGPSGEVRRASQEIDSGHSPKAVSCSYHTRLFHHIISMITGEACTSLFNPSCHPYPLPRSVDPLLNPLPCGGCSLRVIGSPCSVLGQAISRTVWSVPLSRCFRLSSTCLSVPEKRRPEDSGHHPPPRFPPSFHFRQHGLPTLTCSGAD